MFAGKKRMGAERAEENGSIFFFHLFIQLFIYFVFSVVRSHTFYV